MMIALLVATVITPERIEVGHRATQMFPAEWRGPAFDLRVEELPSALDSSSVTAVRNALNRYGQRVSLPEVALVATFSLAGRAYGGTYYQNTIFIACQGADSKFVRRALHHEYSSILLRNNRHYFNRDAWLECNHSEFLYGSGGFNALDSGEATTTINATSAAEGFVSSYGKASFEEDFNLVAENLFEGGAEFWKIVDKAPRLKMKVKIAVAFYEALDPALTEAAFRNHAQ